MNIIEATRKAVEQGIGIRNQYYKDSYFLPTNTHECFLVMPIGYALGRNCERTPVPRWEPKAKDILDEDWELYPIE